MHEAVYLNSCPLLCHDVPKMNANTRRRPPFGNRSNDEERKNSRRPRYKTSFLGLVPR